MAKIEQYNTRETAEAFPGMTPSQTLGFLFRDVIRWDGDDLEESRHQVLRLRSWLRRDENLSQRDGWQKLLDRLDSKEEKGGREANRWFGLVVRRALVDEGLIDGDSLALAAEVERSWGKIERMGFGVEVNLRTGSVRLRQSDGIRVPKITAVQYDDTSKFGKAYGRLLKKYGSATLAGVGTLSVVTGCVVPPVSVENTPVAEVTEVATSKSVALIIDREEANKLSDAEANKIASDRLDQIKQYCESGFGDKMEAGSEMYLLGVDEKGTPSIWGFCKAEIDGDMAMAVVYFDSMDNMLDTKINKKMVVFEDNSVGYEDDTGRHIILQRRPGNKYDVLDINGYVIVRSEDAGEGDDNSKLTWMLNIGVTPVSGEAPTSTPPATVTETVKPTEESKWEVPDASLVEQIKSTMPAMWVYDHESKTFIERPVDDLTFSIFERTTLYIYDKDGNEVGFARYFTGSNLENKNTEYYSLVDESVDTIIPMRFYSQMGDFGPADNGYKTVQCLYAFSDNMAVVEDPYINQTMVDYTQKYAKDIIEIPSGEEMVQTALVRAVAMVKGVSEDQIMSDLKNGIPVIIDMNGESWEVNKGVDFVWGNSDLSDYEIDGGRFVSYDGAEGSSDRCFHSSVGLGLYSKLWKTFGKEIAYVFGVSINPSISIGLGRTSTVSAIRDK